MDNDYADTERCWPSGCCLLPLLLIFAIAGYVISSFFLMRIFEKAGVQGKWRAWVPVYNILVFAKLGDSHPWVMLGAIVLSSAPRPGAGARLADLGLVALAASVLAGWRVGLKLGRMAVPAPLADPRARLPHLARHPRLRQGAVEPEHRAVAVAQLVPQGHHGLAGHPGPAGRRGRRRCRPAGRLPARRLPAPAGYQPRRRRLPAAAARPRATRRRPPLRRRRPRRPPSLPRRRHRRRRLSRRPLPRALHAARGAGRSRAAGHAGAACRTRAAEAVALRDR